MDLVKSGAIYHINPFASPRAQQIPRQTNGVDFKIDSTRAGRFDELFCASPRAKVVHAVISFSAKC